MGFDPHRLYTGKAGFRTHSSGLGAPQALPCRRECEQSMTAPVVVFIGMDMEFHEKRRPCPHMTGALAQFAGNPLRHRPWQFDRMRVLRARIQMKLAGSFVTGT